MVSLLVTLAHGGLIQARLTGASTQPANPTPPACAGRRGELRGGRGGRPGVPAPAAALGGRLWRVCGRRGRRPDAAAHPGRARAGLQPVRAPAAAAGRAAPPALLCHRACTGLTAEAHRASASPKARRALPGAECAPGACCSGGALQMLPCPVDGWPLVCCRTPTGAATTRGVRARR